MGTRILFGGMISSGKSTLVCSVYELLRSRGFDPSLHEIDVWSDTHDCILGRKDWSQRNKRTPRDDDEIHAEFRERVAAFADDPTDIALGDMPGREQNRSFPLIPMGLADIGVLLYRRPDEEDRGFFSSSREGWYRLMRMWGIPEVIEVQSIRPGDQAAMDTFAIDGLDRIPIPDHPEIQRLTEHLLARAEALQTAAA